MLGLASHERQSGADLDEAQRGEDWENGVRVLGMIIFATAKGFEPSAADFAL